MAFVPTEFYDGGTVTAEDLNAMSRQIKENMDAIDDIESGKTEVGAFTQEDRAKLDGIEEGATKTVLDTEVASGGKNAVTGDAVYKAIQNQKVTADSSISSTSTNPVQNKAVYEELQNKQDVLTTEDKQKIANMAKVTVDSSLSSSSTNPVQNKVVKSALEDKQDKLTIDSSPTRYSSNPISSDGVYWALKNMSVSADDVLPAVSEADDGKVLMVVDGQWTVTYIVQDDAEGVKF